MAGKFGKIIRMTLLILVLFIIVVMIIVNIVMQFSKYKTQNRLTLEKVEINDSKQWISLSELTLNTGKPVILFLHGGPGSANLSILNILCPNLEKNAIVVNWDQRGAGKSFNLWSYGQSLSFEQNINDAHKLTKYLKDKFKVDRITLLGFSSGTAMGMLLIKRYPEDYNLFISVSQLVDGKRGELISLDYALKKAREANDAKAIADLQKITYDFNKPETILDQTQKARSYLIKYGGIYHSFTNYWHEFKCLWYAKEYSIFDIILWPLASSLSLNAMWHEVVLLNMEQLVPSVNIPVVFFSGAYDMNTPASLIKEYYEKLQADKGKELIFFENSAHGIFWDEPAKFEIEVIKALKKYPGQAP